MTTYTVRLEDETIGTISSDTIEGQHASELVGEIVKVHLHDENGNPVEREGRMVEVLQERDPWN